MAAGIELATAWVRLVPSMKGATGQIVKDLGGVDTSKIGKSIGKQFAGNIGNGIKSAATGTVAVAAGVLGTALVKGLGRLNALDQANNKLIGLGHSTESVAAIMKNALASVKGTAFGMDDAATVAASAVAAGIKPGKDLERTLTLVADAATIAGIDMGSMGAIFNKVAASNKVQMDVINQLHDAGVPALASLAEYMGVTAEEATKMASSGTIDFATFQEAMETTLGGAAQSSGNTFSGAMANVGAAIGRVGANLLGGFFPKLAPLFQSITKAIGPMEDQAKALGETIGSKVTPVIEWLTKALQNGIGEFKVVPQLMAPAVAAFIALGSSGLAPLLRMVPGLGGFASKLAFLGGPVGIAIAAFAGLVAVSPELQAALGSLLGALGSAGASLAPVLEKVAAALSVAFVGAIQVAIPVVSGIVEALAGLIGWLTDSDEKVAALTTVVGLAVGGWIAYKGVMAGISFAQLIAGLGKKAAAFAVATAAKAKDLALTAAIVAMYVKDFVVAAARTVASIAAQAAAWVANTAAQVASRAAMVASRVAMGAATAAQWLFNAALAANPIGLVIAAVAALVAGLVWFFTQTELGQEIWSAFMTFLSEAWTNIVTFATDLWNGLAQFFTDLWNGIVTGVQSAWSIFTGWITSSVEAIVSWWNGIWSAVGSFFSDLWNGIVTGVQSAWSGFTGWITSSVQGIVTWWNSIWTGVGSFFSDLWQSIVGWVTVRINAVRSVLFSIVNAIVTWWRGVWTGVSSFFSGLWDGIVNVVRGVGTAFSNVFNGIRNAIKTAFAGVVNIVKAPINAIIGLINGAIRSLNRLKVSIPDWVPGFGGQTFGINLPTIPRLAEGATVLPRKGGTLAVLAEAGRPESVVDTGLINRALEEGLSRNGQAGMVVQGPLVQVDTVIVDDDQRVDELAEALYEKSERATRAEGGVNLEGPTK